MSRFGIAALAFAATVQAIVTLENGENGISSESPPIHALPEVPSLKEVLLDERHPNVVKEAVNASVLAKGLAMMNLSRTYYNDLKAMEHLSEVYHNDGVTGENSLCYTLFSHIEDRDRDLNLIRKQLETIVGNDAKHPDKVVVTDELVQQDIQSLKSVMVHKLRGFIDRLLAHSDLNVRLRMLNTLSVDMMNSGSMHRLIDVLISRYMETLEIENDKQASKSLPDQLLHIDNYIKEFESLVKRQTRTLSEHLKRTSSVANPPVRKEGIDTVDGDCEERKECIALGYQVNSVFYDYQNLIKFAKVFNASHKALLNSDPIIAETDAIYVLGMKVLRNALLYHSLYSEEMKDFNEGLNRLTTCSKKLKLTSSHHVSSGIVSEMTVHYLNSEFINIKTFCTKMEDWINGLRLHSTVDKNSNMELNDIVQEVQQVTNDIFFVLGETGTHIRRLYTLMNDADVNLVGTSAHCNMCLEVKHSVDIGLKELRMLIMEWYQQLWHLGNHMSINTQFFEEYNLVGEIVHLVTRAVKALQTDLPIHKKLDSRIKKVLATLSTVKELYPIAAKSDRIEIDDIASSLNQLKDEVEFIISQLIITDELINDLSRLNRDVKDLNTKDNPEKADNAVRAFFKMRSTVHKALFLAESTTIVEMMQARISEYEYRLDAISNRISDLVMESIEDSLPPEGVQPVQSGSSQELVGHGMTGRDVMVYIPEQIRTAPDDISDDSITDDQQSDTPVMFQATVGAIGQAANMARLYTSDIISKMISSVPYINPSRIDPLSLYRGYRANVVPTLNLEDNFVSTTRRLRDNMVPLSNIPENSDDNHGPARKLPRIIENPSLEIKNGQTTGHVRKSSDATTTSMPDSPPICTFQDENAGSLLESAINEVVLPSADTEDMTKGDEHMDQVTQPTDDNTKIGKRKGGSGHLGATSIGFGSALFFLIFTLI